MWYIRKLFVDVESKVYPDTTTEIIELVIGESLLLIKQSFNAKTPC